MTREKIGTRLGFIMLSAGCAIGCGNVWKFPWMAGQNGGGAFVVMYAICLLVLGLPVMTMEFAIGRAAQASPVRIYHKLTPEKKAWRLHGYLALVGNICLMAFYTTVTGWMIYYLVSFITGNIDQLGYTQMVSNPVINVSYMAIAVMVGFFILTFNLQSGLEKVTKYMLSALLVLMIVLAVKNATLPGAIEGYKFYLVPDFSAITPSVIAAAMNQAFFTLSVGIGSMAIFGSYIDKERSLLGESVNVIVLDSFVAIVAGLIIFPSCASFDLEVTAGPALLFDTMTEVFRNMAGGRIWGSAFFLFMVFAAFSTELAVCENILACVRELLGLSRVKGSVICGIGVLFISLTTALGFTVIPFHPFGPESVFLDFWDFIVSTNLLPLGALAISIFCMNGKIGWGWENFMKEANSGKGLKLKNWMRPIFYYILPVCILIVYVLGLLSM
ncbi:MAG: sodium-dependent transporter [Lachnospiraceae bacterium]|nr:sodium-dependent transporter [Lachnospiraceae bacterium]